MYTPPPPTCLLFFLSNQASLPINLIAMTTFHATPPPNIVTHPPPPPPTPINKNKTKKEAEFRQLRIDEGECCQRPEIRLGVKQTHTNTSRLWGSRCFWLNLNYMISDFSNWYGNDYVINAKAEIPVASLMNGFIWLDILLHIYAGWYTDRQRKLLFGFVATVVTPSTPS